MTEPALRRREAVTGRVLVVDDQDPNRLLLRDLLEAQGHEVIEAVDGSEALQQVATMAPDVVLLDIGMPGMDGFEVCRRIKSEPSTASIPVLLVTALSQRDQRLLGIGAGANDYITKPIDKSDLTLRVRNAVRMHQLYVEVEQQYQRLERLELLRDSLVHMIVHDLRSPLAGIRAYLDLLKLDGAGRLDQEMTQSIDEARKVAVEMTEMVSDLLDVSRLEAGKMPLELALTDVGTVATDAVTSIGAAARRVSLQLEQGPERLRAMIDPSVIRRVIANLVGNAIKFTPASGRIRVFVRGDDRAVRVSVGDTGPGIPSEFHEKIFEKFGQVEAARHGAKHSSGLGLTFCKFAVEAHGGTIGVESVVGQGSTFWFVVPLQGPSPTAAPLAPPAASGSV
ncbi:MAG TPA: hybrid sensor histidine kinase/response regulator [Gemmatimonadales bacterium]|nr:hybrid sensor histidine kinase/response regulator [Gemmatimonadales bacterium]